MAKLFLDTNVLMEIIFQRSKAYLCLEVMKGYSSFYISALSVHIAMYYLEKDWPVGVQDLIMIISDMTVIDLTSDIVFETLSNYDQKDFEDGLQVNSCLGLGIKDLLTLDKKLAKNYSDQLEIILV